MINHISFPKLGIELTVNRAAFSIFGFDVYAYGLIIAAGLALGFVYAMREAKRVGVSQDELLNMFLICVPVAIISARLYYVIFSWDSYKNDLLSIFDIRGGGLAIYGGVIGTVLALLVYTRKRGIDLYKILDILAIGLLIGQAIGRWGNFVNGEAFGRTTGALWAMTIETDGVIVTSMAHPTFLYESLWNAAGIAVLTFYKRVKRFNGELFFGYMAWYGFGRMFIEGLRTDSLYIGAFRVSQLLSFCLFAAGVIGIIVGRRKVNEQILKNSENLLDKNDNMR